MQPTCCTQHDFSSPLRRRAQMLHAFAREKKSRAEEERYIALRWPKGGLSSPPSSPFVRWHDARRSASLKPSILRRRGRAGRTTGVEDLHMPRCSLRDPANREREEGLPVISTGYDYAAGGKGRARLKAFSSILLLRYTRVHAAATAMMPTRRRMPRLVVIYDRRPPPPSFAFPKGDRSGEVEGEERGGGERSIDLKMPVVREEEEGEEECLERG